MHFYSYRSPVSQEHERIVKSRELLLKYVAQMMPFHCVYNVPGDGLCILNSFIKSFESVGKIVTISQLKDSLMNEITVNKDY